MAFFQKRNSEIKGDLPPPPSPPGKRTITPEVAKVEIVPEGDLVAPPQQEKGLIQQSSKLPLKLQTNISQKRRMMQALKMPSKTEFTPQEMSDSSTQFFIDTRQRLIELPDFKKKEDVNIRYPLIIPYAYAHITWDDANNELVYVVEEPKLTDDESELLKLVHFGLEEMINVSFARTKKLNLLIKYLEKNVQAILLELGVKVTKTTYNKIMYYIYRDSVGLNEIEPMLNDFHIEDIECNGYNYPIYIVHRKFENLRTSVMFTSNQQMTDFVEKLAQKSGRYVSYAKPLLDGTLPDGSRVNATYTQDVTTRGPTFTIRKFSKEPWTVIHLMNMKTGDASLFAYLWLAVEHKFNFLMVGETGSGKTTFLTAVANFIPPEARICSIEDTREINLIHLNWLPAVTRAGFGIPNLIGGSYGEITLFDLLKESFRQNPDYVIVGEVRGQETFVLFQGMASGHPSFSTFHAGSIKTLVRRLMTPPISLSSSLVETLDIVCILTHVKTSDKSLRRLKSLHEIETVSDTTSGDVESNVPFSWDPIKDDLSFSGKSNIFQRISKNSGMTVPEVVKEFKRRKKLLKVLQAKNIIEFKDVGDIVNEYYKSRDAVLKRFGITDANLDLPVRLVNKTPAKKPLKKPVRKSVKKPVKKPVRKSTSKSKRK